MLRIPAAMQLTTSNRKKVSFSSGIQARLLQTSKAKFRHAINTNLLKNYTNEKPILFSMSFFLDTPQCNRTVFFYMRANRTAHARCYLRIKRTIRNRNLQPLHRHFKGSLVKCAKILVMFTSLRFCFSHRLPEHLVKLST